MPRRDCHIILLPEGKSNIHNHQFLEEKEENFRHIYTRFRKQAEAGRLNICGTGLLTGLSVPLDGFKKG